MGILDKYDIDYQITKINKAKKRNRGKKKNSKVWGIDGDKSPFIGKNNELKNIRYRYK